MDQAYPNFPLELQLKSGRYRIISEFAGTAIQVSEDDNNNIVTWEKNEEETQQWFVQKSGSGYKFKNCRHERYLAVASTDEHALIYASGFPTTWALLKSGDCYIVPYPDNKRVLDLHGGLKTNGNKITLCTTGGKDRTIWRFERIGDDTGEELPEVFRQEMDRLKHDIAEKDRMLTEQSGLISRQETTIHQLEQDLQNKSEALVQVRQISDAALQPRKQQAELRDELLHQ